MDNNKYNFDFGNIEVRSSLDGKTPEYVIKGYAVIPEMKHAHKYYKDSNGTVYKSLRSLFTKNFENSMLNQLRNKKVFIDTEHDIASKLSIKNIVNQMVDKAKSAGLDMESAKEVVNNYLNINEIPMFKVNDFKVDDNGLFVEIRGNRFFRDLDDEHKQYFDAIWGSIEEGFLSGLSINFTPTKVVEERDDNGLYEKIDDGQVYGISILGQPAIDGANITEVAVRALQEFRQGEKKMGNENEDGNGTEPKPKVTEKIIEKVVVDTAKVEELQKQLEQLQTENEQFKKQKIDEEKQSQEELMSNLQKEILELKQNLNKQKTNDQQSVVKQQHPDGNGNVMDRTEIREKLKNLSLGEALQLQADFKLNNNLPPDTRFYARKGTGDIVVNNKQ